MQSKQDTKPIDKSSAKSSAKPSIGVYSLTGCAGCQLVVLFSKAFAALQEFNIKAFPFIKEDKPFEQGVIKEVDYAIVEGLVANKEDLKTLKLIRENSKTLIALGACACTGSIPAYRQFTLPEHYKHLFFEKRDKLRELDPEPISNYVDVDILIPGCPVNGSEVYKLLTCLLTNKKFEIPNNPLCVECKALGNTCLLLQGKPCMGPITIAGCGAVCITKNIECWCCRGPHKDANFKAMVRVLKNKGFSKDFIKHRFETFVGLKIPMLEVFFDE